MLHPYYQDASITIYHGDCREIIPKLFFDALLTDPPYGIAHETGWERKAWTGQIKNDQDTSCRDEVISLCGEIPMLIFGVRKMNPPIGTRMILIWDKGPALGMGALDLPWKPSYEEIYVIGKGFKGHRGGAVLYHPPVQSMAKNGRVHPNEKPVQLIKKLLMKMPSEIVCDPFMGSGTTLRAAKDLGRKAIGIEIEEKYCEIAAKKMAQEVLL